MRQEDGSQVLKEAAVHPAVITVQGDQTRRWCMAVWSTDPGEDKLVTGIRDLVEVTTLAAVSQPPSSYEEMREDVNSLDVIFYETPSEALAEALEGDGWREERSLGMSAQEYEQLDVLRREAAAVGHQIADRPSALWRLETRPSTEEQRDLAKTVRGAMDGQVWGQSPGWFSKVLCDAGQRQGHLPAIGPTVEGLSTLEKAWVPEGEQRHNSMWLVEPMIFQGICDLVAVVLAQQTELEVQWGSCPIDEASGLAPGPLVRVRKSAGTWKNQALGRDVLRELSMPWGSPKVEVGSRLAALVSRYIE